MHCTRLTKSLASDEDEPLARRLMAAPSCMAPKRLRCDYRGPSRVHPGQNIVPTSNCSASLVAPASRVCALLDCADVSPLEAAPSYRSAAAACSEPSVFPAAPSVKSEGRARVLTRSAEAGVEDIESRGDENVNGGNCICGACTPSVYIARRRCSRSQCVVCPCTPWPQAEQQVTCPTPDEGRRHPAVRHSVMPALTACCRVFACRRW